MFRAIYESTWYHPVLFWIAGAAFLAVTSVRRPPFYAFFAACAVEILADATLTSPWSPVAGGSQLATIVSVVFVVLGDARYFLLLERLRSGAFGGRAWLVAAGLSVIVPLASLVAQRLAPGAFGDARVIFLTYEAMFVALALAMRLSLPRRTWPSDAARRWATRATDFEIAQYALWALADVVILAGHDVGYALRLVPNTMYYAFFLPFVAWSAPREQLAPWREARA